MGGGNETEYKPDGQDQYRTVTDMKQCNGNKMVTTIIDVVGNGGANRQVRYEMTKDEEEALARF